MARQARTHYDDQKDDLVGRLRRMEGQVRGISQMIDDNRYCLDVVQQINALTSAANEISVRVLEAHLRACVNAAVEDHDGESAIAEMTTILRKALRQ